MWYFSYLFLKDLFWLDLQFSVGPSFTPSQTQQHFDLQICVPQPWGKKQRENVSYQKM